MVTRTGGRVQRRRFAQEDTRQTARRGPSGRPKHTPSTRRGVQDGKMVICLHAYTPLARVIAIVASQCRESTRDKALPPRGDEGLSTALCLLSVNASQLALSPGHGVLKGFLAGGVDK